MLSRAQSLLLLYAELGVPQDKLILRVPATWAGIQAAAELEQQGIATQAFHIYRCGSCVLRVLQPTFHWAGRQHTHTKKQAWLLRPCAYTHSSVNLVLVWSWCL
eukprot:GHRQ01030119.1.p3 GENE.GHRQ01030119.1~~GHRQ01030119.1.p3  ORF type:complete len:111 (-),score=32.57 GHRQ01030119.1:1227-1538(-)